MAGKKNQRNKKEQQKGKPNVDANLKVEFKNSTRKTDKGMSTKPRQRKDGETWLQQRSAQKHVEKMAKTEKAIKNSQEVQKTARTAARSAAVSNAAARYAENMNGGFVIGYPSAPNGSTKGGEGQAENTDAGQQSYGQQQKKAP